MRYLSHKWLYLVMFVLFPIGISSAAENIQVAKSADLVWAEFDGIAHSIWFSSWQQGAWTPPQQIAGDATINLHPQIDTADDGSRLSAWTRIEDGHFSLRYSQQKNGVWSEPGTVSTKLASSIAPSVLIDKQNTSWIVWAGNDNGLDDIYFSRLVKGAWQPPQRLHPANDVPDILPQLTRDPSGHAQVIWQSYHNGAYRFFKSTWTGDKWTDPLLQSEENESTTAKSSEKNQLELPDFVPDPQRAFLRIHMSAEQL